MTYAFSFDATFCSGCKACQAACKDKNDLPLSVLWRRVIEISGGTWQRQGEAWHNTVFAYHLSLSCNHCVHPKCAGVCPAGAYDIREDGIVFLDTTKCIGCGYCAWACPYGAPQYNPDSGAMTKCNFCFDDIEQGLPPACVAACPMRVLDYEEGETNPTANTLRLWEAPPETHPFPLPTYSHTQPRLAIKPHAAMDRTEAKFVGNLEEIQPRNASGREEMPLILFTLLMQMAVGGFWAMLWLFPRLWRPAASGTNLLDLLPFWLIGFCLGAGLLASLAHLGTKKKAWRALINLRKSWLSREILFSGFFGTGWLITALASATSQRSTATWMALTAALGLGLIYSMSRVYRLPAVPAWNTRRTGLVFMLSALLLGQSLMAVLLPHGSNLTAALILILLLIQLLLMQKQFPHDPFFHVRIGLTLTGMAFTATSLLLSGAAHTWIITFVFLIVLAEETVGKWSFYQAAHNAFSLS